MTADHVGYRVLLLNESIPGPIQVFVVSAPLGDDPVTLKDSVDGTGNTVVSFTTNPQLHKRLPGVVFRTGCYVSVGANVVICYQAI